MSAAQPSPPGGAQPQSDAPAPAPKVARPLGRRRFLKASVAGAVVLAGAGAVAFFRTRGYDLPASRAAKLTSLAAWEFVVVQHVARRIAAPDHAGAEVVTADDVDVAGFVDAYVAGMHPKVRGDLKKLFAFVEHLAPLGAGMASRFTRLGPADQDKVLASLEASDQGMLHGGFEGLKSLVFMGYYRDPRTWPILGYEGPMVLR